MLQKGRHHWPAAPARPPATWTPTKTSTRGCGAGRGVGVRSTATAELCCQATTDALNRDPMILYRHAPSKAALLDGVAEIVLAQLQVDPGGPGLGRAAARHCPDYRLWRWLTRTWYRCWLPVRCPPAWGSARWARCARSKASWRCSPGPGSAGPTPCTFTVPYSGPCTATSSTNCRNSSRTRTRPTNSPRLGLHRLPIGEFPLLRSLAPILAAYDGAAELERGLDILLAGLASTLTPQTG